MSTDNKTLREEMNKALSAFADYIRHHERTGLGGANHQTTTRESILAAIRKGLLDKKQRIGHPEYCDHCGGAASVEAIPVAAVEELLG